MSHVDGQMDWRTGMTKLTVTFRKFANALSLEAGPSPDHEHDGCCSFQYEYLYVHKFMYVYNVLLHIYYVISM